MYSRDGCYQEKREGRQAGTAAVYIKALHDEVPAIPTGHFPWLPTCTSPLFHCIPAIPPVYALSSLGCPFCLFLHVLIPMSHGPLPGLCLSCIRVWVESQELRNRLYWEKWTLKKLVLTYPVEKSQSWAQSEGLMSSRDPTAWNPHGLKCSMLSLWAVTYKLLHPLIWWEGDRSMVG